MEFLAHYALANLLDRLAFQRHLVGVKPLLCASSALRPMEAFKATVQAGMAERPITAAIAGKLVKHVGDLSRILVHDFLPGVLEERPLELFAGEKRG